MGNLYEASNQWANRPDDERFESLHSMYLACKGYASNAKSGLTLRRQLQVVNVDSNLALQGSLGIPATLTHYSFGQLARLVNAPADYLRRLPPALAAININTGLANLDGVASLLFHKNGQLVTRAITSTSYDRIWNHEVIARLGTILSENGWVVPPARPCRPNQKGTRLATAEDILPNQGDFGLRVKVGDPIAPAGLYASDHDMFAFMVNQTDPVFDGAKFLNRGVFIQNSEVGDCALKLKLFTYDNVCGNHIVWDVGTVRNISVRHIKRQSTNTLEDSVTQWSVMSNALPSGDEAAKQIHRAQVTEIGADKDAVLDAVFSFAKKRSLHRLTKATVGAAFDLAENTPRYGSPTSVWGLVNGLTEYSQSTTYQDERAELDTQAGRLMEIAF